MPWDIRHDSSGVIHEGLERETVRELLSTRQLVVTDWARPAPSWPWHQLATIDDFCDIAHSQRRRRKQETAEDEEEMDMTPMIDVTFLLLIFFIVTLKFKTLEGRLSAALPKDVGVNPTPAEPIEKVDVRIEVIDPGERVGAFPFNGNFAFVHTHTGDGTRHEYQGHPRHDFRGRRLAYHVLGRKFTNLDDLYARFQKLYEKDPERPAAAALRVRERIPPARLSALAVRGP